MAGPFSEPQQSPLGNEDANNSTWFEVSWGQDESRHTHLEPRARPRKHPLHESLRSLACPQLTLAETDLGSPAGVRIQESGPDRRPDGRPGASQEVGSPLAPGLGWAWEEVLSPLTPHPTTTPPATVADGEPSLPPPTARLPALSTRARRSIQPALSKAHLEPCSCENFREDDRHRPARTPG